MDKTELGDRMKIYEVAETNRRLMPLLPVYARIDGRSFSKFTKGMKRPYDEDMQNAMIETTKYLVDETHASMGYTQSDEISLVWYSDELKSQLFFDGKIQKVNSTLSALASVKFMELATVCWPDRVKKRLPTFDCRVFNLPTLQEAVNCFVWREHDCTKNSITMAASVYYSHKQLMNKNSSDKQDMLMDKDVNWNDYPASFKRGTYVRRQTVLKELDAETLANIPEEHRPEGGKVMRSEVVIVDMPPITQVVNRVGVFFGGDFPITNNGE